MLSPSLPLSLARCLPFRSDGLAVCFWPPFVHRGTAAAAALEAAVQELCPKRTGAPLSGLLDQINLNTFCYLSHKSTERECERTCKVFNTRFYLYV